MAYDLTNRHLSQDAYLVAQDGRPSKRVALTGSDGRQIASFYDSNNTTTTPLASSATFTGTATNILDYSGIGIMVYTDVNSANDGLTVQFSFDGSDWHDGESYTIPAGTTKFFTPPKQGKYFRVTYTNNGDAQSEFHIHTLVSVNPFKWSSHNLKDNLNDEDDAELNLSVLKLRTAADTYVSGAATNNGNFKVSLEEFEPGAILPTSVYSINNVDDDGNDANPNYYGFEKADGGWYIMKEDKSTNPIVYTYSTGSANYSTAWTNRASQSYDTFGNTF